MSLLSKTGLRRALVGFGAFAVLSATLAAPALADHDYRRGGRNYGGGHYGGGQNYGGGHYDGRRYGEGRHYGGGYWRPPFPPFFPIPRFLLGLPPVVILGGGHDGYDRGGRQYDGGYDEGYDDGYDDRDRDDSRYRRERYDRGDCDHGYR